MATPNPKPHKPETLNPAKSQVGNGQTLADLNSYWLVGLPHLRVADLRLQKGLGLRVEGLGLGLGLGFRV